MQSGSLKRTATLIEAQEVAKGIRLMRLAVPPEHLSLEAGAHVVFAIPKGAELITRHYSVVDDGQSGKRLTIAVKLERNSNGGSRHMWSLQPGDTIEIVGNGNDMPASFSAENYVVLAGGIGVTPMSGMVRVLRQTGKPVRMVYCAQSPEHAAFVPMFQALLGKDLDTRYDSEQRYLDMGELLDPVGPDTVLFMCGPLGLMDAVKQAWRERALPIQNLRYETFASSGNQPTSAFDVLVEETGRTVHVAKDQNLLDALLASGHEVLSDCRRGECGLCKLEVTAASSEIDHRDVLYTGTPAGVAEIADGDTITATIDRIGTLTSKVVGST